MEEPQVRNLPARVSQGCLVGQTIDTMETFLIARLTAGIDMTVLPCAIP